MYSSRCVAPSLLGTVMSPIQKAVAGLVEPVFQKCGPFVLKHATTEVLSYLFFQFCR